MLNADHRLLFSVIIPTYNRCEILAKCLNAINLLNFDLGRIEVIVCDDGSTDNTAKVVEEISVNYKLNYIYQKNAGPGAARNKGIMSASGEYLLILNDDAILDTEALNLHYKTHIDKKEEKIAVLGRFAMLPQYCKSPVGYILENSDVLFNYNTKTDGNYYNYHSFFTCNISIKRESVIDIGLFDENFSAPAAEDIDLGFRLFHQGWRVYYVADCLAWHDHHLKIANFTNTHKLRGYWRVEMFNKHRAVELKWFNDADYQAIKANLVNNRETQDKIEQMVSEIDRFDQQITGLNAGQLVQSAKELLPLVKQVQFYYEVKGYLANPWFDVLFNPLYRSKPLVSVIVPCYNYARYLTECVESVIRQTWQDFEIIIVNDGSTDDSLTVAYELYKKYTNHRIRVIDQPNSGQPAISRNNGIKVALGKYILPLDADDYLFDDTLEAMVKAANDLFDKEVVIYGAMQKFGVKDNIWPGKALNQLTLLRKNQLPNTSLYNKTLWEKAGGYHLNVVGYEDWEFWIRLQKIGADFVFLGRTVIMYRTTPNSSMLDTALARHEYNFANIVNNNRDMYHEYEVEWAVEFLKTHPAAPKKRVIFNPAGRFDQVYASMIKNSFPGTYSEAEHQWADEIISRKMPDSCLIKTEKKDQNLPKQKILFVCHDFPPHRMAGAQLYAKNLAQAINQSGRAEVEIFYPVFRTAKTDYNIEEKKFEGLTVFELCKEKSTEPGKVYNQKVESAFTNFLKNKKYQIIHFHGLGQLSLAPVFAAKKAGILTAMTFHDYWFICDHWHLIRTDQSICTGPETLEKCTRCYQEDYHKDSEYDQVFKYQQVRQELFNNAFNLFDYKFAPSQYLIDKFTHYGLPGIEKNQLGFIYPEPKQASENSEYFTFGYIGQFIQRKGINYLISAFRKITNPAIRLMVWGKSNDSAYCRSVIEQMREDNRIIYRGGYSHADLPMIYNEIDIAVLPTLMDNYPLGVFEAFYYSRPIIAARVGGVPETVVNNENGWLFEAANIDDLRDKMLDAINNPVQVKKMAANVPRLKTIQQDADIHLRKYHGLTEGDCLEIAVKQPKASSLRIVFAAIREMHLPVLIPIYKALDALFNGQNPSYEIGFMSPAYKNSVDGGVQEGLSEKTLDLLRKNNIPFWGWNDSGEKFACVVFPDLCYWYVDGWGPIVNVGHGTISKGIYFTDQPIARRENYAEVLCVPGSWYQDCYHDQVLIDIVATGFSKMDELYGKDVLQLKREFWGRTGFVQHKTTILFAPTFNVELTSLAALFDEWRKFDADKFQIVVKLHGVTDEELKKCYRDLAKILPNMYFAEEPEIADFMLISDLLISDVSSAYLEYLVLGKPVILYDNPDMCKYAKYNPQNVEFLFRDAAYRISVAEKLADTVSQVLNNDYLKTKREESALLLFGQLDGKNSERIAVVIKNLVQRQERKVPTGLVIPNVLVAAEMKNPAQIILNLTKARFKLNVFAYQPFESAVILKSDELPPTPFILMDGTFALPEEWDYVYALTEHFNKNCGLLGPVIDSQAEPVFQRVNQTSNIYSNQGMQNILKYLDNNLDLIRPVSLLNRDCLYFSNNLGSQLIKNLFQAINEPEEWKKAFYSIRKRQLATICTGALFAYHNKTEQNIQIHTETEPSLPIKVESCQPVKKLTVQFYVLKNVHWAMFENLVSYVAIQPEVEKVLICIPDVGGVGFELLEEILQLPCQVVTVADKSANLTFVADTVAGKVLGCGKIVNIGHGTISKGYYFTESIWTERENMVDLLCVPGNYAFQQFSNLLRTKVVATGMPKLDPVFNGAFSRENLCRKLQLDPCKKIVLYAPTFNIDLSSIYDLIDRFSELAGSDRYILIKLHGSTLGDIAGRYQQLAHTCSTIRFIEDPNLAPYLGGADVMISDVSSAFMEFMALDKPVILYNNPRRVNYHGYDPENIEYKWRDLANQANDFDRLKTLLNSVIKHGDTLSDVRKKYAAELFADLAGNAAKNVWQESVKLLAEPQRNNTVMKLSSIFLRLTDDNLFVIRNLVRNIQFYSVMPVELIIVKCAANKKNDDYLDYLQKHHEFYNIKIVEKPILHDEFANFLEVTELAEGEFVYFMRDCVDIYKNFCYINQLTFANNPDVSALSGLNNHENTPDYFANYLDAEHDLQLGTVCYKLINLYQGREIVKSQQQKMPDLIVLKKTFLSTCFNSFELFKKQILADLFISKSFFYSIINHDDLSMIKNYYKNYHSFDLQKRVQTGLQICNYFAFIDLNELLIDDLIKLNFPKKDILKIAFLGMHLRLFDQLYKQRMLSWFPEFTDYCAIFKRQIDILKKLANQEKQASSVPKIKIMFYFFKNVHIPILLPIYLKLKENYPNVEIAFGYKSYEPQIRAGFLPEELEIIRSFGEPMYESPQEFGSDICFIADSVYPWTRGCGKWVNVGHGILSKGQYYTNTAVARREQEADLVCVPGSFHEKIMKTIITKPVMATGMGKLDELFSGRINRKEVLNQLGLPLEWKYILYAPTFNDELSSIRQFGKELPKLLFDEQTAILIKLHGSTKSEYKEYFKSLAGSHQRIYFIEDLDITPYMAAADVMISDVSSAMMEFAALDKPVVLYNNPERFSYVNYNADDIEYKWRDLGVQADTPEDIIVGVRQSLANPTQYSAQRKIYTDQLFANKYDGNGSGRIITAALNLIRY